MKIAQVHLKTNNFKFLSTPPLAVVKHSYVVSDFFSHFQFI